MEKSLKMVGGVGNTPLTYTKVLKDIENQSKSNINLSLEVMEQDKRMVLDWVTATFGKIDYVYKNGKVYIHKNSFSYMDELLYVLTADKSWRDYDEEYARNNYKKALVIGEHIRIQFYGPKNKDGNHTTMVDMSGQACREFEERGGSWLKLFELLLKWDPNFSRLDPAIDDFSGKEFDLYDLINYVLKHSYTSCFRKSNLQIGLDNYTETYDGLTIYLGSSKSNQLAIYDKKLEQESKNNQVFHKIWYRYEMRLKHDKATTFVKKYLVNVLKNGSSEDFGTLLKSMLFGMLDLKIRNNNDSNKQRWETEPKWINFLDSVEKIKLVSKDKPKQTIDKKKLWIERSVLKALTQIYLVEGNEYFTNQLEMIAKKIVELKDKDIEAVNKFLNENKMKNISKDDLYKISNNILEPDTEDYQIQFDESQLPF